MDCCTCRWWPPPGRSHSQQHRIHVQQHTCGCFELYVSFAGWTHVQVVVAPHSHIIGKSVRELRFRTKYDAAIVAVQRRVSLQALAVCRWARMLSCSWACFDTYKDNPSLDHCGWARFDSYKDYPSLDHCGWACFDSYKDYPSLDHCGWNIKCANTCQFPALKTQMCPS